MHPSTDFVRKFVSSEIAITSDSHLLRIQPEQKLMSKIYTSPTFLLDAVTHGQNLIIAQQALPLRLIDPSCKLKHSFLTKRKGGEQFYQILQFDRKEALLTAVGKKFVFQLSLEQGEQLQLLRTPKRAASCVAMNPASSQTAIGYFEGHDILLVEHRQPDPILSLDGHVDAITQLKWTGEHHLISRARCDNYIYQWDVRSPDKFVRSFQIYNDCQQRLYFDVLDCNSKQTLACGDQSGSLHLFDLNSSEAQPPRCIPSLKGNRLCSVKQSSSAANVVCSFGQRLTAGKESEVNRIEFFDAAFADSAVNQ